MKSVLSRTLWFRRQTYRDMSARVSSMKEQYMPHLNNAVQRVRMCYQDTKAKIVNAYQKVSSSHNLHLRFSLAYLLESLCIRSNQCSHIYMYVVVLILLDFNTTPDQDYQVESSTNDYHSIK